MTDKDIISRIRELIQEETKEQRKLVKCANTTQYLQVIQEIYNFKNRDKINFAKV